MSEDPKSPLALSGCLDFSSVQKLADDLLNIDTDGPAIRVDANEVEQIGTPAVQVLVAAALQAEADGQSFKVVNKTDVFQGAFEDLGLSEQVEKWSKD